MSGIIGVSPDMRSGVVGNFPVGQVVNTSFDSTATSTAISSTTKGSGTSTTLTCVHQAKRTTNKLRFRINLQYYMYHTTGMGYGLEIHDGSSVVSTDTVITTRYFLNSVSGSDVGLRDRYIYHCEITPASTAVLTYTVRLFKYDGGLTTQNDSTVSTIEIQEIQV